MERKKFFRLFGAGSLGVAAFSGSDAWYSLNNDRIGFKATEPKKKVLMKVGCQSGGTTKENLEFKARCGVFNIDGGAPKMIEGVGWDLEDSLAKREACEKYGITLEAYHLPLDSSGIERTPMPNIMLGRSPERDREMRSFRIASGLPAKPVLDLLPIIQQYFPFCVQAGLLIRNGEIRPTVYGIMKKH